MVYLRYNKQSKKLILIVESLHWINLFVHITASHCNKELELSGDEMLSTKLQCLSTCNI